MFSKCSYSRKAHILLYIILINIKPQDCMDGYSTVPSQIKGKGLEFDLPYVDAIIVCRTK